MDDTSTAGLTASRRAALRPVIALLAGFLVVSAAMIAVLIVLTSTGTPVEVAVWIRCSIVLVSAIVPLLFALAASRGSRGALVRLRIFTPIILTAIVVIVSIPGFLPVWVRFEQALCGALLLPAVILMFLPRTGALFPRTSAANAANGTRSRA